MYMYLCFVDLVAFLNRNQQFIVSIEQGWLTEYDLSICHCPKSSATDKESRLSCAMLKGMRASMYDGCIGRGVLYCVVLSLTVFSDALSIACPGHPYIDSLPTL